MDEGAEGAEVRRVQVDFEGLMKVVGANLYSTPMVAVRELVQNAHDSCARRRIEAGDGAPPPRIVVRAHGGALEVEDNGAGLTRQEIIDYLATIGSGFTRRLREAHSDPSLIGAFGLGFLSAYVLGKRVEVRTSSHTEPDRGWLFSSRTGERFTLAPIEARARPGTVVRIELKPEHEGLQEPERLARILRIYCGMLPAPIELEGWGPINDEPAPWRAPGGATLADAAAFAAAFDARWEPAAALPIPPDASIGLRGGVLWVHGGGSWATSDLRSAAVYVRGMLVKRDDRDMLPAWAGCFGAVVDSDALTPTASREDLIRDEAYVATQARVRTAIIEGLERLRREEPGSWAKVVRLHNETLLGAAISDDRLFALLGPHLTVPSSSGDRTLRALTRGARRVYISLLDSRGPERVLMEALGRPVVDGSRFAVYPFARRYCAEHGAELIEVGSKKGNARMFPPAEPDAARDERLAALLGVELASIVATRFAPPTLPLLRVYDQDAVLKGRIEAAEAAERIAPAVLQIARGFTASIESASEARLYVNLDAPLIAALLDAQTPSERARHGGALLGALAGLMAADHDGARRTEDLLAALSGALGALLGPGA